MVQQRCNSMVDGRLHKLFKISFTEAINARRPTKQGSSNPRSRGNVWPGRIRA